MESEIDKELISTFAVHSIASPHHVRVWIIFKRISLDERNGNYVRRRAEQGRTRPVLDGEGRLLYLSGQERDHRSGRGGGQRSVRSGEEGVRGQLFEVMGQSGLETWAGGRGAVS